MRAENTTTRSGTRIPLSPQGKKILEELRAHIQAAEKDAPQAKPIPDLDTLSEDQLIELNEQKALLKGPLLTLLITHFLSQLAQRKGRLELSSKLKVANSPTSPADEPKPEERIIAPNISRNASRSLELTIRSLHGFQTSVKTVIRALHPGHPRYLDSIEPTLKEIYICYNPSPLLIPHAFSDSWSKTQFITFTQKLSDLFEKIDDLANHSDELGAIDTVSRYNLKLDELNSDLQSALKDPIQFLKQFKTNTEKWLGLTISRENEQEAFIRAAVGLCLKYKDSHMSVSLETLRNHYRVTTGSLTQAGFSVTGNPRDAILDTPHREFTPDERTRWHNHEKESFGWDVPAQEDNSILSYAQVGLLNLAAHIRGESI